MWYTKKSYLKILINKRYFLSKYLFIFLEKWYNFLEDW
jgi:hypothetical protein